MAERAIRRQLHIVWNTKTVSVDVDNEVAAFITGEAILESFPEEKRKHKLDPYVVSYHYTAHVVDYDPAAEAERILEAGQ